VLAAYRDGTFAEEHAPRCHCLPSGRGPHRRASRTGGRRAAVPHNDPGTPGNGNWEINIAAMQTTRPEVSSWQLPQLDVNYGERAAGRSRIRASRP
jgi:hypothetical protein